MSLSRILRTLCANSNKVSKSARPAKAIAPTDHVDTNILIQNLEQTRVGEKSHQYLQRLVKKQDNRGHSTITDADILQEILSQRKKP